MSLHSCVQFGNLKNWSGFRQKEKKAPVIYPGLLLFLKTSEGHPDGESACYAPVVKLQVEVIGVPLR